MKLAQNQTQYQQAAPAGYEQDIDTHNAIYETPRIVYQYVYEYQYIFITAAVFGFIGLWWWWKKRKSTPTLPSEVEPEKLKAEEEPDYTTKPCPTCAGTGEVAKTRDVTIKCAHCKGSGIDICHHCGGTGKYGFGLRVPQSEEEVQSFMGCDYCEGKGNKIPAAACCMCKGTRKESYKESYKAPCPTCGGSGKVKR